MKTHFTKLISIIVVSVMLLSALPISVFAAEMIGDINMGEGAMTAVKFEEITDLRDKYSKQYQMENGA